MNPDKVVMHIVDRQRRAVIVDLLAERIGQACVPPQRHANREVLALDVARADVLRIGIAANGLALAANAFCRAVALLPF